MTRPLDSRKYRLIQAIMNTEDEKTVHQLETFLSDTSKIELSDKTKLVNQNIPQLINLLEKGYEVFGQEKFQLWMQTHNKVLKSKPIDMLNTSEGIQQVEDILGRIEHGVYS